MRLRTNTLILLSLIALVALLTTGIHGALQGNPLGADFYTFWKAARAEFIEGRSAYDPSVAREIQVDIQGRLSNPGEDQFAFSYPVFALLLVAPFSLLPFDWAQAAWMAVNFVLLLTTSLALSSRRRWVGATFWAFYPVCFALILGNLDLILAVIWLYFFSQVLPQNKGGSGNTAWMGVLVAVTTLKPQFSWFFLILAALVALRQKSSRLILGFLAGSAVLWSLGFLWHPHWLSEWVAQAVQYLNVLSGHSSPLQTWLAALAPPYDQAARAIIWIVIIVLSILFTLPACCKRSFPIQLLGWCGIVTYFVHPTGFSYDQMTFLIPVFLWAVEERSNSKVLAAWMGMMVLSWVALAATLTGFDRLADSSWLLFAAAAWLAWIAIDRNRAQAGKIHSAPQT